MYKFLIVSVFVFSGCANYPVNGTMCDEIATDPKQTIPKECRVYLEEKAAKASRGETKLLDPDNAIKFEGEEK